MQQNADRTELQRWPEANTVAATNVVINPFIMAMAGLVHVSLELTMRF